jgi:hypothetical protein
MSNYDLHIRVYNFMREHEYKHMLWTYIDLCRREAERHREIMQGEPQPTEAEYNLAQDYIINEILRVNKT